MNRLIRTDTTGASDAPRALPSWMDEVAHGLAIRAHFVLSGDLTDSFPVPDGTFVGLTDALWQILGARGVLVLLIYNPIDGLRLHDGCDRASVDLLKHHGIDLTPGRRDPETLVTVQRSLAEWRQLPAALIVEGASHLGGDSEALFLSAARVPLASGQPRPERFASAPPHNPVFWLVDNPSDLPEWFTLGNDRVREIRIELPNLEDRFAFASRLFPPDGPGAVHTPSQHRRLLEQVALECEGETLVGMRAIADLARAEGLGITDITDVLRIYRTGSRRNPWTSQVLRSRMAHAPEILGDRVKGQDAAIEKTLDILTRSITGLSGAQTRRRHARPRGVLFFAGPTGVGKTELAKSVTELLFGDDAACHSFDMSEFMDESAILRLLGAPPGQPGHERGGELINAMHSRPFSVVLFDEIEKAHPRILDVFLQILDEGRLTDARGSVAHFSEALIIFTSNIGMFGSDHTQNMGMNVMPSDPYDQIERKITAAVQDHFRYKVQRPELMNRIGQNVVVFDFINHRSVHVIFDAILARVVEAISEEHGIEVTFSEAALADLKDLCTHDVFDGGRGIGNRIETHFINPVSREIFDHPQRGSIHVERISGAEGRTRLTIV